MSKSRYMKASELGIPHKELRALIWVLKRLRDGTLNTERTEDKPYIFSIQDPAASLCELGGTHWCGTAACIGGWAGLKMYAEDPFLPDNKELLRARDYVSSSLKTERNSYGYKSPAKEALFYENLEDKTTPAKAADALEHYLLTGEGR